MGIRRRSHRRRHGAPTADSPRRRPRAARPLSNGSRRVALPAVLLAGPAAHRARNSNSSRPSTTTTAWRSSPSSVTTSSRSRATTASPEATQAEVAFTVQDDQQGRGLATLLLEHLAVDRARATASTRSWPTRCPNNRRCSDVFRDAGLEVVRAVRRRHRARARSRSTRRRRRMARAGASASTISEARVDRAAAGAPLDRGDRREPPAGDDRPRGVPQPARVRIRGPGLSGAIRTSASVAGVRAYPTMLDVPDASTSPSSSCPPPWSPRWSSECADKDVHGLVIISRRVRRGRSDGKDAEQRARRARPPPRHADRRAELPRRRQHRTRTCRMNATFAPFAPVRGARRLPVAVGRARHRAAQPGRRRSASASRRSCRSATRPTSAATTSCSTGTTIRDTDVILLYLESFGNPRKFARLARRVGAHASRSSR